jgi:hypothetical protein
LLISFAERGTGIRNLLRERITVIEYIVIAEELTRGVEQ